jgi:hypothetical protein
MSDSKLVTICTVIIAIVAILTLYYTVYSPSTIQQQASSTQAQIQPPTSNLDQQTGLLTYENSTYGIRMQYPSDWITSETNNFDNRDQYLTVVTFDSPGINSKGEYIADIMQAIDKYPSSLNLNQYMKDSFKYYRQHPEDYRNLQLIESSTNSLLGGHLAYKMVYTYTDPDTRLMHEILETGTIIDGKGYYIYVNVDADKYPYYLPTIQKMIDSFQII